MIEYLYHILIIISIYSIVGMSLNLLTGYTGLVSLAHAAFYGIGAYTAAILSLKAGFSFCINVPAGIIIAGILAVLVGIPSLRVRDDYFVISTFAFQIIIYSIMNNWISFTGGPLGLKRIPHPEIFGIMFSSRKAFLCLVIVVGILSYIFLNRLVNSSFGRILKAIREDEIFTMSLGKDVAKFKLTAFVISASIASVGGNLYAYYITFIDPSSFTIMESIFILSIVIIGGAGRMLGSILGSAFLILIPEMLRFIGMPGSVAANMRQIVYGLLLVILMKFRPQGLLSGKAFCHYSYKESRGKAAKNA